MKLFIQFYLEVKAAESGLDSLIFAVFAQHRVGTQRYLGSHT